MARPESLIQQSIVEYLRIKHIFCFSCPNGMLLGGRNNFALMGMLKKEGLLPGVSDIIIVTKKEILFVEIKTEKGVMSDNQKDFQKQIESLGYKYLIWKSLDDCLKYPF